MRTVLATGTVKLASEGLVLVPTGPPDADSWASLQLLGDDLPPNETRVVVEGELSNRSLWVTRWRTEPHSTSSWAPVAAGGGVSVETAQAILDEVPDEWPIISIGESRVSGDRRVIELELDEASPEVSAWAERQPRGSVRLVTFISPKA